MANSLSEFLKEYDAQKHAEETGIQMHEKLRLIRVLSDCDKVDCELKRCIESCNGLSMFFTENALTEVPIAGMLNGAFVSRRIDRLIIDDKNKVVRILDYKTDINKTANHEKYIIQLNEYSHLMHEIYPKYKIESYILWLHDWVLEKL